ncbi:MAG: hypothetical protein GX299_10795 [Epulopiscium sp.]|nr:hypothetical protein [Candidatus Epulonipiscium sp.]
MIKLKNKDVNRNAMNKADAAATRQNSDYSPEGKAAPNNNIFFEERSNPLSSKGN